MSADVTMPEKSQFFKKQILKLNSVMSMVPYKKP